MAKAFRMLFVEHQVHEGVWKAVECSMPRTDLLSPVAWVLARSPEALTDADLDPVAACHLASGAAPVADGRSRPVRTDLGAWLTVSELWSGGEQLVPFCCLLDVDAAVRACVTAMARRRAEGMTAVARTVLGRLFIDEVERRVRFGAFYVSLRCPVTAATAAPVLQSGRCLNESCCASYT